MNRLQTLLVTFLLLHPPVLEPDLDLCLVQLQRSGDLDAARTRQVLVKVELFLKLGQLLRAEVRPGGV